MLCPKCQAANPRGSKFCQNCQSILLAIPGDFLEDPQTVPLTGRLESVKDVCEMVKKGEITLDEFSAFLSSVSNLLAVKAEEITELVESSNYASQAPQEVEAGFKGMDLYEAGLTNMILFISTGDPAVLDEGLKMIAQGNEFINQAMELNQKASRNLQWDIML